MTLKNHVAEEFRRNPLSVSSTVVGVIIAACGLLIAWLQFIDRVPASEFEPSSISTPPHELSLANILLVVSFFLAASFSTASIIRMIARTHAFPALVLSILGAILVIFASLLVLYLAPPKKMTPEAITAANDAVFYGTVVIFIAFNGLPVISNLAAPISASENKQEGKDEKEVKEYIGGMIGMIIILLLIWSVCVGKGQEMLVRTFLPW